MADDYAEDKKEFYVYASGLVAVLVTVDMCLIWIPNVLQDLLRMIFGCLIYCSTSIMAAIVFLSLSKIANTNCLNLNLLEIAPIVTGIGICLHTEITLSLISISQNWALIIIQSIFSILGLAALAGLFYIKGGRKIFFEYFFYFKLN